MRIDNSYVKMQSTSYKRERVEKREERIKDQSTHVELDGALLDLMSIDVKDKELRTDQVEASETTKLYEISDEDYQKVQMLEKILSALTGKDIRFTLPESIQVQGQDNELTSDAVKVLDSQRPYMRHSFNYSRVQSMSYEASGQVKTSDGRVIDFNLQMQRSDSFELKTEYVVDKNGQVIDPLVINYDGQLSNLTKDKYEFDLDFDGATDQISFLQGGSGYLAFDKDGDGAINDGRELFGPSTGDGFSELGQYDQDGNGWIDENDRIFNQLRLWNKDDEGNDVLFALGEVGVGAIYLGHVASDYALGSSPLQDDGFIRSTGLFLKESGEAGSIHHIDLSI